ncbi:MAG: 2-C-methyl-D-erythritol 4-phosphate cytidylyltransferase [Phycisphaeraceae bacterium]
MNITVIIPAAGLGKRFTGEEKTAADPLAPKGGAKNKIELDIRGRPVFLRSIEIFQERAHQVGQILLAVNPDAIESFKFKWGDMLALGGVDIVPGGRKERWETILNALKHVSAEATHVAVHDAARPLATRELVDRIFEAAKEYDAVIPALPVASTLKKVEPAPPRQDDLDPLDAILGSEGKPAMKVDRVVATVSRASVVEVQTPQVFEISLFRRAYARISEGRIDGANITDDAGLIEAMGESVYVVEGEPTNMKITRKEDIDFATAVIQFRESKTAKATAKKRLFADEDED